MISAAVVVCCMVITTDTPFFFFLFRVFCGYDLHFLKFNYAVEEGTWRHERRFIDEAGVLLEGTLVHLADVAVAVEADFFVGQLSNKEGSSGHSNKAGLVNMLQHSRGDGGRDFHSIDDGSSWEGF